MINCIRAGGVEIYVFSRDQIRCRILVHNNLQAKLHCLKLVQSQLLICLIKQVKTKMRKVAMKIIYGVMEIK